MKLSDEFEDQDAADRLPLIYTTIGIVTFFAFVICIVVALNHKDTSAKRDVISAQNSLEHVAALQPDALAQENSELAAPFIGQSNLTSDQLDFWNMYKDDTTQYGSTISANMLTKDELYEKNLQKLQEEEEKKALEEDLTEGGKKTMVERPDGTQQWIMINAYIEKNTYDEIGFVYEEPVMKYFQNGTKQSQMGAVLSDDCGDVNFVSLRKAGVDFVMIRVGYRGYESGVISQDAMFETYLQAATDAGLKVGAYFESQAISEEEAQQEADYTINLLYEKNLTYPVVYRSGLIPNAVSRVEYLTKSQSSQIANAFCDKITQAGYRAAVYGDKYWLLRRMDLTLLGAYDIWLSQEGEVPDYPYAFSMWQYENDASISGVDTEIPLCISFVDYSRR